MDALGWENLLLDAEAAVVPQGPGEQLEAEGWGRAGCLLPRQLGQAGLQQQQGSGSIPPPA